MGSAVLHACVGKLCSAGFQASACMFPRQHCASRQDDPGIHGSRRRTFRALSCVFGFLFPIRFFSERMASFGWTVLDRMVSEISRFRAMSSLERRLVRTGQGGGSENARLTGCCSSPSQSAHLGPCWLRRTTKTSSWFLCGRGDDRVSELAKEDEEKEGGQVALLEGDDGSAKTIYCKMQRARLVSRNSRTKQDTVQKLPGQARRMRELGHGQGEFAAALMNEMVDCERWR